MIRLGSLAGYPFEGPRLLAGWTPPPGVAAVYAITCKPDPSRERHAVIYVGACDDLSAERFPFKHPRAASWIKRAGSKWQLHVCFYEVPGGGPGHREQIARELIATYRPSCNEEQYQPTWKPEWIGDTRVPELYSDYLARRPRRRAAAGQSSANRDLRRHARIVPVLLRSDQGRSRVGVGPR